MREPLSVLLLALFAMASSAQQGPEVLATVNGWDVLWDGTPVLSYTSWRDLPKPWVDPFFTPAGRNVVTTSPPDHIHHRGLMFAWGSVHIEGEADDYACVFWGEGGDPHYYGRIVPDPGMPTEATTDETGATIVAHYEWRRNSDDMLILRERRTLRVTRAQSGWGNLITWISEQAAERDLVIGTTPGAPVSYYGLGIRCAADMDRGLFVNSNGGLGVSKCNGDRAEWCAYQGGGDPLRGFALFDHPDNPRYPTGWFAMNTFGYLTASLPAFEPYQLEGGETLRLTYGALAFDGPATPERIEACYEEWLTLHPPVRARWTMPIQAAAVGKGERIIFAPLAHPTILKPAYHPVASPEGYVVTDPDSGQRHHHGLWFAWGKVAVGGREVDFWSEGGPAASTGVITTEGLQRTEDEGGVTYHSRHLWRPADGTEALIEEERVVRVHSSIEDATLVTFTTLQTARQDLVVSAKSNEAVSYYGLCLQMPDDMHHGLVVNANGSVGREEVEGEPARWCAYSTDVRPTRTVAFFDHPANPRHPSTYFTLPTGFLSASLVATEDYPMQTGDTLVLTYGVLVTDEPDARSVERHYQTWLGLQEDLH